MGHHKRETHLGYCFLIALLQYSLDNNIVGLERAQSIVADAKPQADAKQDNASEYDSSYNLWSYRIRVRSIVSRITRKDLWVRCHIQRERVVRSAWWGSKFSVLIQEKGTSKRAGGQKNVVVEWRAKGKRGKAC